MAKKKDPSEVIRDEARAILREQQRILARAGAAAREAGSDFGRYAHDEVLPRFLSGSRRGLNQARHVVDDVLPTVGAAVGAALNLLDGKAPKSALATARKVVSRATKSAPKNGAGVGAYVGIGIGIAALIGIGYIAYQTFRADDELWVEEPDDL